MTALVPTNPPDNAGPSSDANASAISTVTHYAVFHYPHTIATDIKYVKIDPAREIGFDPEHIKIHPFFGTECMPCAMHYATRYDEGTPQMREIRHPGTVHFGRAFTKDDYEYLNGLIDEIYARACDRRAGIKPGPRIQLHNLGARALEAPAAKALTDNGKRPAALPGPVPGEKSSGWLPRGLVKFFGAGRSGLTSPAAKTDNRDPFVEFIKFIAKDGMFPEDILEGINLKLLGELVAGGLGNGVTGLREDQEYLAERRGQKITPELRQQWRGEEIARKSNYLNTAMYDVAGAVDEISRKPNTPASEILHVARLFYAFSTQFMLGQHGEECIVWTKGAQVTQLYQGDSIVDHTFTKVWPRPAEPEMRDVTPTSGIAAALPPPRA